jgi:uncharacterized membrane protein YidH (DUF202 family)
MTEPYERDVGASAERTRLAWRRTSLSATTVALLAVRPAFKPHPGVTAILITAGVLTGWAALVALGYRRSRGLKALPPYPGHRAITLYAVITIGIALIGGLVVTI